VQQHNQRQDHCWIHAVAVVAAGEVPHSAGFVNIHTVVDGVVAAAAAAVVMVVEIAGCCCHSNSYLAYELP